MIFKIKSLFYQKFIGISILDAKVCKNYQKICQKWTRMATKLDKSGENEGFECRITKY